VSIQENINKILQNIEEAKILAPFPEPVTLVAVTKFQDVEKLRELRKTGQCIFGENRVQELLTKVEPLRDENITWHVIGHLQTNKVRQIIDEVSMIHSLDRLSLAEEIEKRASAREKVIEVLIQVNIADEEQKFGMSKEEVPVFLEKMQDFPHLKVMGLMLIAPNYENKEDVRPIFKEMYTLFSEMKEKKLSHVEMKYLSMGMSGDYRIAVEEGANMVRIGSAIFK
jgi:pyridoxal phosphate enzyme, yggS family